MSETAAAQQVEEGYLRKFSRELPVTLNDHELQTYGQMLATKVKEEELAEEKKKEVVASHSARIKAIRVEIKRIADARAKGEELRPVVCGERLRGNVIEIVRLDSGAVVDTRPAELSELQLSLPGTGMPAMPEGFDEGPRGAQLGELQDQPVEDEQPAGEMVESSSGDQVYVGAPDDHDDETRPVADDVDETHSEADHALEGSEPADGFETFDGDVPDDEEDSEPDNVLRPDFAGVVGQGDGESEDELIDRKLREREEAEREEAEAKSPKPAKATRERSKAKNTKKKGKK